MPCTKKQSPNLQRNCDDNNEMAQVEVRDIVVAVGVVDHDGEDQIKGTGYTW